MLAILIATALTAPPVDVVRPRERAAYHAMLVEKALSADTVFAGSPCPDAQVQDVATQDVKIAGRPDVKILHEKLQVTGCGRSTTQNLFAARAGGSPPWRMTNGMPGDSLADTTLQSVVWAEAEKQAHTTTSADCAGQRLGDIYVVARPGHVALRNPGEAPPAPQSGVLTVPAPTNLADQKANLDVSQAWVEIWPIAACGQDRTVAVVVIPLRDHAHSAYELLPVWRYLRNQRAALPPPAPETDQGEATAGAVAPANPAL